MRKFGTSFFVKVCGEQLYTKINKKSLSTFTILLPCLIVFSNFVLTISIFFIFFCSFCMAEGKEPKGFSFDDDDDEWMSSKVTGFKFEDDDETPFQGQNTSFISSLFWPRLLFTMFAYTILWFSIFQIFLWFISCSWHQTTKQPILFSPFFSTNFSQFE